MESLHNHVGGEPAATPAPPAPWHETRYPRLLDTALAGVWPRGVECFSVEELELYPFCGEGEHAAVRVEKVGVSTRDLAAAVAKTLGLSNAAVGYAGMKDVDAVAVQSFTVTGADEGVAARAFEAAGARVLTVSRHTNKLRLGHLAGNSFKVFIRGGNASAARETLAGLARTGVPNYFGPQRFGREGRNVADGIRMFTRGGRSKKMGRWKRDLLVSSVQSSIFNHVLAARLEAKLFSTALMGDVLQKTDSGGIFHCEESEVDTQRVASGEVSPTGPMHGKKMRSPLGRALEMEEAALAAHGLAEDMFKRETGTRRALRAQVVSAGDGSAVEEGEGGIWLSFTLGPGVYATSVVREVAESGVWRVEE